MVLEFFSGLHVLSEVGTQIKYVGYRQLSFLGKQKEKIEAFSSIPVKRRKREALESKEQLPAKSMSTTNMLGPKNSRKIDHFPLSALLLT